RRGPQTVARPAGRGAAPRRERHQGALQGRRRRAAARCPRLRTQQLQDRAGEARHRPRLGPGRRGGTLMTTAHVGKPVSRVDGRAKVSGTAKYAAEYSAPALLHGVVVSSTIARGRITKIDASEALALDGVLEVF